MKKLFYLLSLLLSLSISIILPLNVIALDEERCGVIVSVEGEVYIISGVGEERSASKNDDLSSKDEIKTLINSRVRVLFKDGTMLNVGPDTRLKIEEYLFSEEKDELIARLKLLFGKMRGTIVRHRKEVTFEIKSPVAVVAVRGTDFIVTCNKENGETSLFVLDGKVEAKNVMAHVVGTVAVLPGNSTTVRQGEVPTPPIRYDIRRINKMIKKIGVGKGEKEMLDDRDKEKQKTKEQSQKDETEQSEEKEELKEEDTGEDEEDIDEEEDKEEEGEEGIEEEDIDEKEDIDEEVERESLLEEGEEIELPEEKPPIKQDPTDTGGVRFGWE